MKMNKLRTKRSKKRQSVDLRRKGVNCKKMKWEAVISKMTSMRWMNINLRNSNQLNKDGIFDRVTPFSRIVTQSFPTIKGWSTAMVNKRIAMEQKSGEFGNGTIEDPMSFTCPEKSSKNTTNTLMLIK